MDGSLRIKSIDSFLTNGIMKNILLLASIVLSAHYAFCQAKTDISSGVQLITNGNVHLVLNEMSLHNNGIFYSATGGQVKFTGAGNMVISGTGSTDMNTMVIQKPTGSQVQLQAFVNIQNQLLFTSGYLDLGNKAITLQGNATIAGETETSRAITNGTGYIENILPLNAPNGANPGNLGAMITSASNLGITVVRRGHQQQVNSIGNGTTLQRYYEILPANNTALNASFRFHYLDNELNGLDESSLMLWRSEDNQHWQEQGFTSRDVNANWVEKTGINAFSRWTLSSAGNALPVRFQSFSANCDNNQVTLHWITAAELNAVKFTVERSLDGKSWTSLGEVSATGNSNSERKYTFIDPQPLSGGLYRIASDDHNRTQYSHILRAGCGITAFHVYPNPAQDVLHIELYRSQRAKGKLQFVNAAGQTVLSKEIESKRGTNVFVLPLQGLTPGMHTIICIWENGTKESVRFVKGVF
ncbi:MAG TPA: T9SS type A sorting domain-containing protein [Niastella sp.]|nr:T9SS type A sorting domain-containing protein [Niastella sp.]